MNLIFCFGRVVKIKFVSKIFSHMNMNIYENIYLGAALVAALVYRKYARENNENRYYQKADEFEACAV
jgi:hypothetical protein